MENCKIKKFKKIYIEITNICNLNCSFCPETTRTKQFMSSEQFEYIAKKIKPYGDYIYLHVKGEPLLHKELSQILDICERLNLKVCITTNGTLIDKNINLLLSKPAIHKIHISLHSFEASIPNLTIEQYINNICYLIKNADFLIVLRFWNEGGLNKLNNDILKILQHNFSFIRDDKINERTYIENGEKFEWANLSSPNKSELDYGFCYALRNQIGILVDGSVVPCCLDNNGDITLGNIFESDLQDIYNTPRALSLIQNFSNRKFSENLCRTCGFIKKF